VSRQGVLLLSLLFLVAAAAQAQIPTAGNIFFGYSYAHAGIVADDGVNTNGWNASLEGKLLPWVGIVADFAGHYGSQRVPNIPSLSADGHINTFLFGPRVSVSVKKFRPFAEALFGAGHTSASTSGFSNSDTSFATALGGGIDYRLMRIVAWRGELDFLQTRFYGSTQNDVRFSTGIVINF